ncbi:MAG: DUF5110 domain-containing protein [Tannerella sp.]|nr:DUF5110 domain-containing protein [Tannerella sp.]
MKDEKLPLEIRHYGNLPAIYNLYDDDGNTFDYEKGEYSRISLEVSTDKDGKKSGKVTLPKNEKVWSFSDYNFRFMTK